MVGLLRRIGAWIRDAWLVIGITLAMLVGVELAYRAQGALRRAVRGEASAPVSNVPHPNDAEPWWRATSSEAVFHADDIRYDPFRGWWPKARSGRYVNIDTLGRRATPQAPLEIPRPRTVHVFGGSSMWGWIVRDSFTVPALLASELRARGIRDVRVINHAQSTFDLAQNAATLLQEIRFGRIPDVAVFVDGNNEVAPAYQNGRVGSIINERLLAQRFERQEGARGFLAAVSRHSELVRRFIDREAPMAPGEPWRQCDEIAASYREQARALAAVGKAYAFTPLFYWQPQLANSRKQRSPWERSVSAEAGWQKMVVRCSAAVDSAMSAMREVRYQPLHALFDHDTLAVFTDAYGHVTERANAVIAHRIATDVAAALGRR